MTGVFATSPGYLAAVAGLPLRSRRVEEVRDAVVVIDGVGGWVERAAAAAKMGAAALVIADPGPAGDQDLLFLEEVARGIPLVIDRPRVRADVAADAGAFGSSGLVTADVTAVAAEIPDVVRDAVAWLRILAGGNLVLRAGSPASRGAIALFDASGSGSTAALTVSTIDGRGGARLRAHAIGETRVEVDLDAATAMTSVDVATVDGVRRLPARYEDHERLTLRRALDAVVGSERPQDLAALRHDRRLARDVLRPDKRG